MSVWYSINVYSYLFATLWMVEFPTPAGKSFVNFTLATIMSDQGFWCFVLNPYRVLSNQKHVRKTRWRPFRWTNVHPSQLRFRPWLVIRHSFRVEFSIPRSKLAGYSYISVKSAFVNSRYSVVTRYSPHRVESNFEHRAGLILCVSQRPEELMRW